MQTCLKYIFGFTILIMLAYTNADPMRCVRLNEILDCMSLCPEETCQTRGTYKNCSRDKFDICRVKCLCKKGYYRDGNYNCIEAKDCVE